jgi:DNA invertase Pin-like site-specific DNA recombinase
MVAAMAAEIERDLIRERALDGLRAAEAQGRRGGRRPAVDEDVLAPARPGHPAASRSPQSRAT